MRGGIRGMAAPAGSVLARLRGDLKPSVAITPHDIDVAFLDFNNPVVLADLLASLDCLASNLPPATRSEVEPGVPGNRSARSSQLDRCTRNRSVAGN